MQGALQGPSYPALFSMAVKWVPLQEQTRVISVVCMGKNYENIILNKYFPKIARLGIFFILFIIISSQVPGLV